MFEQAKATTVSAYWNQQGIPTPLNGVIPKGESGTADHDQVPDHATPADPAPSATDAR